MLPKLYFVVIFILAEGIPSADAERPIVPGFPVDFMITRHLPLHALR